MQHSFTFCFKPKVFSEMLIPANNEFVTHLSSSSQACEQISYFKPLSCHCCWTWFGYLHLFMKITGLCYILPKPYFLNPCLDWNVSEFLFDLIEVFGDILITHFLLPRLDAKIVPTSSRSPYNKMPSLCSTLITLILLIYFAVKFFKFSTKPHGHQYMTVLQGHTSNVRFHMNS